MALGAVACLSLGTAAAQEMVVKIGHVGPVSGPQAHYGKDNENGVRLAVDDLNDRNLRIGGKAVRFVLVAEDDAADPKQGTAAAQKLCDMGVNGVVGHLNSGTTLPAAAIYQECGIPHITPSATNPQITRLGYKTTFRIIANDNALGDGVVRYAATRLGVKRLAIIDDRTAYGTGMAQVVRKVALASGMQVVDEQFTSDKAFDFMSILTLIKSRSPDAIFFAGFDAQAGPMLRQMQQLGMTRVRLLGGDGVCTEKLIELAGGASTLNHVVCAEGGASLGRMPSGTAWKARYDRRFPGQFQVYAPYAYDAAMMLAHAMVQAGSADPAVYLPVLASTTYQGVTAAVAFDASGELRQPSITLYEYRNNRKQALP
jgi:branched-chain amino acid transport system substrate-binding protein